MMLLYHRIKTKQKRMKFRQQPTKQLLQPLPSLSQPSPHLLSLLPTPPFSGIQPYYANFHPKEGETVLDATKCQINLLHEALSSHLLITSVIEGYSEHLTMHQTASIRERYQFRYYPLPSTICLCWKIGKNAVRLPLELPQKLELHHLKIQEWWESGISHSESSKNFS